YQLADQHGTGTLSIDSATTDVNRRWTDPFGVLRGSGSGTSWAGDKGFVNGLKDDATGFTTLGARQYQPSTGRFLSPDPLMLADDPQQWNAYAYSNNDPVNKTDPTGMALEECATGFAKCSNMGTKVDTTQDGPNYQRIVAEIKRAEPIRKAGYVEFVKRALSKPHPNAYTESQVPVGGAGVVGHSTVQKGQPDDQINYEIGAELKKSNIPLSVSVGASTTQATQWSEQYAKKKSNNQNIKTGAKVSVEGSVLGFAKTTAEGSIEYNYEWGEEETNTRTDGKSTTTQETTNTTAQIPADKEYGFSPLGRRTNYVTTYYHEDGTVTTKEWGTYQFLSWNRVVYDHAPAEAVDK
ncbi:RHS repeat-associated core domain-containing protein, partial [Kitasatospora sp. NPDC059146]|uniref:RHS repeat-associated core domain-containing protein n=1 Tax=Kitasatospora sp. NPDC059146 TaxID=3346741 RepID=UPI0036794E53